MTISKIIKFEGPQSALVWKHPEENITATSQLIVDETHEALMVVNGIAADLFGSGRRTLSLANIPIANSIINIPTGGENPFPCKIFFVNKVHKMDLLWGTFGPIALEDPLYDIFMHVMANGSISFKVANARMFLLKLAGFEDIFEPELLTKKFRGIISSHVKDCISKIMINGLLSYFMINAHTFEMSQVVKERLDEVFNEYGIEIQYFNIETIEVPPSDYEAVKQAKEKRSGRIIEGYSWQEERQMLIAEKFASNQGTIGNVGGAVGGFMMGGALGGSIVDIAKSALDPSKIVSKPPKDTVGTTGGKVNQAKNEFSFEDFYPPRHDNNHDKNLCSHCQTELPVGSVFCPNCGNAQKQQSDENVKCPQCNTVVKKAKFCSNCGFKIGNSCTSCGKALSDQAKFCPDCGKKVEGV
jgi:membrane protease subunit (stomatin/prohibitin family)